MQVPDSVTFGFKILEIPTLEEMGIPLAGLGLVKLHEGIKNGGYDPRWISRGDPLLTYKFWSFQSRKRPFFAMFNDPVRLESFEIASPVSGLLLSLREEYTLGFAEGLQYEWCQERLLPIILVPNDEPPPDARSFYVYERIASHLAGYFDVIPIRDRSKSSPERLRDWIARSGDEVAARYGEHLSSLKGRERGNPRAYKIRELMDADRELVGMVQHLRGKDIQLREKLVHIARRHGESI